MSDTFAVEVFDPSLLITNLGKFERVVLGDNRIGRCENFSYIGGDEGWSGDEQHPENKKPESQSSPSSSEKRISNKHTLIYRMFHVTPNLQPSGKPFSPKQQGRSSEEGGGGRFEHGGRWSGDNTRMRIREGSHLNPDGELVQNRQHGILRVLGNYVDSGQNGPSSPSSSSFVEIGPAGSSQDFLAAVNPTVKLKGREGLHHSRSEGDLLSKDLVVTTKVKSSDPAFPKHYPTESSPTTRRFSSGSKNVNNNNVSEPESPHKPNSPSHQHNIFYRMFYEHHDGENHTKKTNNNNNHPTNSSGTPKSSRRLSINNKHHGGGDHHPVQHHSIFKDLIETGNKVKRSRSLDKIGKLTRSQSDASLSEKYGECQEVLGKGAHAVVQLAHKKDTFCREKLYAVKRFRKRPKDEHPKEHIKKLTAEFCIASTLHHENVCETVDLIQDEHENWCEVMEYCPGGDLYTRIKAGPMNQLEIDCFFKQLIHGLAYIHSMGVAHRDIKPENLLLDASGHILKIADFGVSVVFRTLCEKTYRKSKGLCGSEPYIACEEFTVREYHPGPVDLWAAAVVYYTMVYRAIPWIRAEISRDPRYAAYREATTIMEQFDAKSANPIEDTPSTEKTADSVVVPLVITTPRRDPFSRLSLGASNVICHMLKSDPEKRWTAQDVKRDSWFAAVECCYECHWNDHHGHTEVDEGNGHI